MKKKTLILIVLLTLSLIVACRGQIMGEKTPAVSIFPTATSHFFFQSDSSPGALPLNSPDSRPGMPTVASIFHVNPTATPFIYEPVNSDTITNVTSVPTPALTETPTPQSHIFNVSVYKDTLNPNWEVQKSTGIEIYLNDTSQVYRGKSAITFTPLEDYGILYFTVTGKSQEYYPRDRVTGLSFWLYSGENPLVLNQLSIAVISSNSQTFWSANDHPMTNLDQEPVFSETRSYFLDFNRTIPAHTWVPVEFDLVETLKSDPDFRYVTGFYLKTEAGFSRTLVVDDISMEMLGDGPEVPADTSRKANNPNVVKVHVDTKEGVHPISKLIYGVSGAPAEVMEALRPALNSWGGDSSTRYNWENGHAWNAGLDGIYRNGNYGITRGSASDDFVSQTLAAGAEVRLSLPLLGWVAKNDDPNTCSFPLPDGSCGDAGGATCQQQGEIADPYRANVPSYLTSVTGWVQHLVGEKAYKIRFLAMDNEPEMWGFTHYDVHPDCTTYNEILRKHLFYTYHLRGYVPDAEFVGPVTSGWYYYWNSAAGIEDKRMHANRDFLPWFLRQVQFNDRVRGWRSLHVLDLHYYPKNVFNDKVDDQTAALRLRSTRSLWDEDYVDESSIDEPIYLIPRMKALIQEYYPGTKLGLSEWNWGAEKTINGALAIADVLGIFGREDLYYAAYWQYPPIGSPGFFAFKMYTNFNDRGGRFGDISVLAESKDINALGSYAALDSATGDLHIMLVNKQVAGEMTAQVDLLNFVPDKYADMYRFDAKHPERITESTAIVSANEFPVSLPAYSITLLVLHPQQ